MPRMVQEQDDPRVRARQDALRDARRQVIIDAARRVFFVVTGGEKAGMVAEVLEGLRMPVAVPAQAVAPSAGVLTWLLDEAAAAELSPARRAASVPD